MRTILRIFLASELQNPGLYIDPNTGGMLFQLLAVFLALFSGILFFFSRQIRSAFARLKRRLQRNQTEDVPESNEDQQ
jgi:hypothetical protein